MKTTISFIVFLLFASIANAREFSYVYIQGDKLTPFYVKLEGEMLPRYGKNYCIIPKLEPGEIHVDILFQQNEYPAEHFTIKVPEENSRNFLLTKKDGVYALYDLQQHFYLVDGNDVNDDILPSKTEEEPQLFASDTVTPVAAKMEKPVPVSRHKIVFQQTTDDDHPHFLNDIELNSKKQVKAPEEEQSEAIQQKKEPPPSNTFKAKEEQEDNNDTLTAETENIIPNSDCPEPVKSEVLEMVYKKAMQQTTEESRLGYLNSHMSNCYSTEQVGILAKSLDSDAARYAFLKKVYPRTTDQSRFASLEEVLNTEQWKKYFRQMIKK